MAQTIGDGPFHNCGHALPVQSVLARRSLPTQLARQHRNGVGKRSGHSRPRLSPGEVLHAHPAPGALDPAREYRNFNGSFLIDRSRHSRTGLVL
jgi:hypothetical protein